MQKALSERHRQWELNELLVKYPGLRLHPSKGLDVIIQGSLEFSAVRKDEEQIDDEYSLTIQVPDGYPRLLPSVWEVKKRIPPKFHKLDDGSLCLGSETRLRLILLRSPSILSFVDMCVVPYLYGHSFFEKHGRMPFGELSHGRKGVIEDLAELFVVDERIVLDFVAVAAMKKSVANKLSCPCGSSLRLGSCHRKRVNTLRDRLGRRWFAYLMGQLEGKPVYRGDARTSDMNAYLQRTSFDAHRFEFWPLTAEYLLGGTKR
jgi:hypothetical protein